MRLCVSLPDPSGYGTPSDYDGNQPTYATSPIPDMADLKSSILHSLGQESNQPTCSNQGILWYLMTQSNNTPLEEYLSIKGYSILVDICQGSGQGSSQGRLNIPQPQPCPTQQQLQSRRPLKPSKPLYTVMIATAITTLKESGGSSRKPRLMYIVSYKKIADVAKA